MPEPSIPPGWYPPDPSRPGELRYWTGAAWVEREIPPAPPTPGGPRRRSWFGWVLAGAVALIVVVTAIVGVPLLLEPAPSPPGAEPAGGSAPVGPSPSPADPRSPEVSGPDQGSASTPEEARFLRMVAPYNANGLTDQEALVLAHSACEYVTQPGFDVAAMHRFLVERAERVRPELFAEPGDVDNAVLLADLAKTGETGVLAFCPDHYTSWTRVFDEATVVIE